MSASYGAGSVRPHDLKDPSPAVTVLPDGRLELRGISLRGLIFMANVSKSIMTPGQVVDGPSWLDSDLFDVAVRTDGNPVGPDGYTPATLKTLQALVADQFRVATRPATRDLEVYELVVVTPGKLGAGIAASAAAGAMLMMESGGLVEVSNPDPTRGIGWQRTVTINDGVAFVDVQAKGVSMYEAALHFALSPLNGPVLDRTGLQGTFDITSLRYAQTDLRTVPTDRYAMTNAQARGMAPSASTVGDDAASLSKALTEQLGLGLKRSKASLEVLVVENAARPAMAN